jgi:PIN domain nuclease of toxin-antitoxin system
VYIASNDSRAALLALRAPIERLGAHPVHSPQKLHVKCALGKLEADPAEILAGIEPAGLNHLPIAGEHAAQIVKLPAIHKDPFDRLLVAQARAEPMILLTDDETLGGYGEFVEVV